MAVVVEHSNAKKTTKISDEKVVDRSVDRIRRNSDKKEAVAENSVVERHQWAVNQKKTVNRRQRIPKW